MWITASGSNAVCPSPPASPSITSGLCHHVPSGERLNSQLGGQLNARRPSRMYGSQNE